ncbi:MAG TPA: YsnF/AvaK domain-containing protein [Terriglobales bacterium]|nr:YsnF/AvaK domain-containing protein [Terriglobales bacterium]
MAVDAGTRDIHATEQRVIAFFHNREDAYRAITELRNAGFTSDEIGLMTRSEEEASGTGRDFEAERNAGFWDKLKQFFTGDSSEDVAYGDSRAAMDWDQDRAEYYYRGIGEGGALVSVTGSRSNEARSILQNTGGDLRERGFDATAASGTGLSNAGQDYRIQLRGEVLRTYRERVQRGEVRLRKEVVTENRTVDVPVTREELVIERVAGSGAPVEDTGEIGSGQEIRVPLTEERARVEKQPVVNEEVRVAKRAVQNTQRVSDDVKHEELRVDKDGDVEVDTRTGKKGKKPAA